MSFFEDDDAYTEEPGPPTRRYGADRNRQLLVRRAVGVAILVVILILLLLGIKGCLDARKERGLENYVSDMTTVVQQSKQLSDSFFKTLNDPRGLDENAFEQQIAADRGTADTLLSRVEGIDTPGDLPDVDRYLLTLPEIDRGRVLLMPQGVDQPQLDARAAWLRP